MKYIHSLTGLRGLAALIVFISHSANEGLIPGFFGLGFGKVGVMLFFVLSGFLMAHLYIHEEYTFWNVKRYAAARIGRVVPLYYTLVIISILVSNYIYIEFCYSFRDFGTIIQSLLFIRAPSLFWTIPAEVQFYVVFLGLWFLYGRFSSKILLAIFGVSTCLQVAQLFLDLSFLPDFITRYSYGFLLGMVTALYHEKLRANATIRRMASITALPALILLFVNLPVLREQLEWVWNSSGHLMVWEDPLTWLIVYMIFVCALMNVKPLQFLNTKPFVFMGEISYGFYLMHYPVLLAVCGLPLPPVLKFLLTLAVTCVLAKLSLSHFEKIMNRKIRGLVSSPSDPSSA